MHFICVGMEPANIFCTIWNPEYIAARQQPANTRHWNFPNSFVLINISSISIMMITQKCVLPVSSRNKLTCFGPAIQKRGEISPPISIVCISCYKLKSRIFYLNIFLYELLLPVTDYCSFKYQVPSSSETWLATNTKQSSYVLRCLVITQW